MKSKTFFLIFFSSTTYAASLTTPLPPSLWVASDHETQVAVGPPVGSTMVTQPSWAVMQWFLDNNGYTLEMPPGKRFIYANNSWNNYIHNQFSGNNQQWTLANSAAQVKYDAVTRPWLGGVYTLVQNGRDLPSPCGGESDLFLSPKGLMNNLGHLASYAPNGFSSKGPISRLTNLYLHTGIEIKYESINKKCPGDPNHDKVNYGIGLILVNTANNGTFFYQLVLRDSMTNRPANGRYGGFSDVYGNIGVGDYIDNYGHPRAIPGGGRVAYSAVDLLPRIKHIISQGSINTGNGIVHFDRNLNNWRIEGFFFGHFLWGGVIAESSWDNVSLHAYP